MALPPSPSWVPPICLDGSHLFFFGYSEVGRHVTWIREQLDCLPSCSQQCTSSGSKLAAGSHIGSCKRFNLTVSSVTPMCFQAGAKSRFTREAKGMLNMSSRDLKHEAIRLSVTAAFTELRDGLCRENRYGGMGGINASCMHASSKFNMNYRWKTFQSDGYDAGDQARVLEVARHGGPVIVILEGGGPHHFAKFPEHHRVRTGKSKQTLFTAVEDGWRMPQTWVDDYMMGTKALLRRHATAYPSNVCVLWKTMHIGPRSNNTSTHHPSVVNGLHHWLNRLAIAASQDARVGILDLSDLTMTMTATPKLTGAHAAVSAEGDPYHGFPQGVLVPELLQRACSRCSLSVHRPSGSPIVLPKDVIPSQCGTAPGT